MSALFSARSKSRVSGCRPGVSAALLCSLGLVAGACGTSSSSAGHAGVVGAGSRPSVDVPTTAGRALRLDARVSAINLLDAAGYRAALGGQVRGPEDDGGLPDEAGGETSVVRVMTASGVILVVHLQTFGSAATATQTYETTAQSMQGARPLSVGDASLYAPGRALVRKGAQVLQIDAQLGAAANLQLDKIKESRGDPTAALAAAYASAAKIAPALGARLSGIAVTTRGVVLPAGAIDPCRPENVALIKHAFGASSVTSTYEVAAGTPALGCVYSVAGLSQPIEVTTLTAAQLASSLQPKSIDAQFAADRAGGQNTGSADELTTAYLEYNEILHHDPFGWILEINFPGLTRQQCIDPKFVAKGEELIDEMIRAFGRGGLPGEQPSPDVQELQKLAARYDQLADEYKQLADEARRQSESCK
jgi:hypothetical protein